MKGGAGALLLAAALAACCGKAPPPAPPGPGGGPALRLVPLRAAAPGGGSGPFVARVEVAADPASRERGLMGRDVLLPDSGMLFAYPEERDLHYWMKDCPLPLSAAFLDREGRILNIVEMEAGAGVPDRDLPYYDSRGKAKYVLEMDRRWFAEKGLRPGDLVDVAPALEGVVPR